MKNESQPISTKNDASLNKLQFKNRLVKIIAPLAIPLVFGFTELSNIGCGTKGKLQGLEQTINGQKEANKTQDTTIGGLKNNVQNIQTKLTEIEDANKTQLEKQNKTDTTQNEKINAISKTNEEKKAEIEQLQTAVRFLQDTTAQKDELTQDQKELYREVDSFNETSHDNHIDVAWEQLILKYLVEYRKSLQLVSNLDTAMKAIDEATESRRRNILKQVLTTGSAISYSHTRKPIRVTIPKAKTFDFSEVFKTIEELSPNEKIGLIDDIINKQNAKIQKSKEKENEHSHSPQPAPSSSVPPIREEQKTEGENKSTQPSQDETLRQPPRIIYYNNEETIYIPNDYEYDNIPILARARTGERLNSIYTVNLQEGEFAIAYGAYIQKSRSRRTYAMVCVSGPGTVTMHVASGVVDVFAKPETEDTDVWENRKISLIKAQIENQKRYYPSFPRNMTAEYVYKNNHFKPETTNINPNVLIEDMTGDNSQPRLK